jgi:hypothetical protein
MAHIVSGDSAPPHIHIETHGSRWLTEVYIDGVKQQYVRRISFDTGAASDGPDVLVRLEMYADVTIVGDENTEVKREEIKWPTQRAKPKAAITSSSRSTRPRSSAFDAASSG